MDAHTSGVDAGTLDVTPADHGRWIDLTPLIGAAPPARGFHAMAFDEARGKVVLFGGSDTSTVFRDTWEWDVSTEHWFERIQPSGSSGPGARRGHAMAYDGRGVLLFSGGDYPPYQYDDLWRWDGDAGLWVELHPKSTTAPAPRYDHAMAFDAEARRVLLVGGRTFADEYLNDSFEWQADAEIWIDRTTSVRPPLLSRHGLAFDAILHALVMFGGEYPAEQTPYLRDVWQWSWTDTSWTSLLPSPVPSSWPEGRSWARLAFDDARRRMVLVDGLEITTSETRDRWDWDGATRTWAPLVRDPSPSGRYAQAMVSVGGGRILLFGGFAGAQFLGDTWLWDGASPSP